eukprot:11764362-Ditylum_brightwellii.AAC.1
MSSTGPNYARKLHLVIPWEKLGLAQAIVPCYRLVLVYKYLLNCIVKTHFPHGTTEIATRCLSPWMELLDT